MLLFAGKSYLSAKVIARGMCDMGLPYENTTAGDKALAEIQKFDMTMTRSLINTEATIEFFGRQLEAAIIEAAEPMIQEALKKIETQMRQSVAQFAIGSIQSDFDVRLFGEVVEIRIRQGKGVSEI
jgi:hypothetical protein